MIRFKFLKRVVIFSIVLFFLLIVYFLYFSPTFSKLTSHIDNTQIKSELVENTMSPTLSNSSTEINTIENKLNNLEYAGWIPTWASSAGLQTLKNSDSLFQTISPVWYEISSNGSLKANYPSNRQAIITFTESNNLKLLPTIGMFDNNLLSSILNSPEKLTNHIDSVISVVNSNDYAGIDLDYESISLEDKQKYLEYIELLSKKLHENNKILVVTVLPKWGDDIRYPYRPETREVQDWKEISKYIDELRIMAYDYTHSSNLYPGPIGPTNWIRNILDYAKTKVSTDKVVLGVHLYAYEWYVSQSDLNNLEFKNDYNNNEGQNPRPARAYTYLNIKNILNNYKGESLTYEGENIFIYSALNPTNNMTEDRVVVYMSPEGVNERVKLAKEYNLKGVVFWRLGDEQDVFSLINDN